MNINPYTKFPFYPGPTSLSPALGDILAKDYGPPRIDDEYVDLYKETCAFMQIILGTGQEIVMPTGEGMLGLWGTMKSMLKPGDTVVSVGTGVFGDGFGDMALALGCIVEKVSLPYDSTLNEDALGKVDDAVRRLSPVLVTAVHCETPSGTLNPMEGLAQIKRDRQVPFFAVDAVASMGGVPIYADDWAIDIVMGGSQKCLSCPPDMSVLSVNEAAWQRMAEVNYIGYEALLPFHKASSNAMLFPYTPHWRGIACLHAACKALMQEGLAQVFARHEESAKLCRQGLVDLGIELWTHSDAVNSPTVTAAKVPNGFTWQDWKQALRREGVVVGGSFGPMQDKVFRVGHMGSQANPDKVRGALQVMKHILDK